MSKRRERTKEFKMTRSSEEMIQYVLKRGHLELACKAKENKQGNELDETSILLALVVKTK